jgi:hypothetical protein
VEVWDLDRNESIGSFPGWSPGTFSADGRLLTVITRRDEGPEKKVRRWVYGIGIIDIGERRLISFDDTTSTWGTYTSTSLSTRFVPECPTLLAWTAGSYLVVWDTAASREVARRVIPPWWTFTPDGEDVLSVAALPGRWTLSRLEWQSGHYRYQDRQIGSTGEQAYKSIHLSPDGRRVAVNFMRSNNGTLVEWLYRKTGWRWLNDKQKPNLKVRLFDAADASLIAEIPGAGQCFFCPDGHSLVALHQDPNSGEERVIKVWDIPPPKLVGWFTAGALLSAVPIALLARWRTRHLCQTKSS